MQIKWRSAIERKNIETILYGTTLGNSKMDQWIHLVFSTARTNSSFHSFFFQLVNFYDIFLLRQLAWDKKRITSSKNLYKFHRSWSLQKKERTHVSKRLRTKEIIMGWSSGEWIIIFIPTTPFPLKESIDVTYKSPRFTKQFSPYSKRASKKQPQPTFPQWWSSFMKRDRYPIFTIN